MRAFCSQQWSNCRCGVDIRWGNDRAWHTIPLKGQGSQEISCDSVVLGTYVIIYAQFGHADWMLVQGNNNSRITSFIVHSEAPNLYIQFALYQGALELTSEAMQMI